jgi:large subunit ribosomal protein L35
MPKMKTHKGIKKRVRVTAKGKIKYRRPNAGHLMSGKSGNRCRAMRRPSILGGPLRKRMKNALAGTKV